MADSHVAIAQQRTASGGKNVKLNVAINETYGILNDFILRYRKTSLHSLHKNAFQSNADHPSVYLFIYLFSMTMIP